MCRNTTETMWSSGGHLTGRALRSTRVDTHISLTPCHISLRFHSCRPEHSSLHDVLPHTLGEKERKVQIYDTMYVTGAVRSWREVKMDGLPHLTRRWLQSSQQDRSTDQSRCHRSHHSDIDTVQSRVPHTVLQDRLKTHMHTKKSDI